MAREEYVVTLTAAQQTGQYSRLIYQPMTKPIQYRLRFGMKSGDVREDADWQTTSGPQLLVNQPYVDVLRVSLLPTGDGWDDVVSVQVDLQYVDAGSTIASRTRFRSRHETSSRRGAFPCATATYRISSMR